MGRKREPEPYLEFHIITDTADAISSTVRRKKLLLALLFIAKLLRLI